MKKIVQDEIKKFIDLLAISEPAYTAWHVLTSSVPHESERFAAHNEILLKIGTQLDSTPSCIVIEKLEKWLKQSDDDATPEERLAVLEARIVDALKCIDDICETEGYGCSALDVQELLTGAAVWDHTARRLKFVR